MDWSAVLPAAAGLLTLFVGWLLRGEYSRFTEQGRLPDQIDRRLALWEKMPNGETKDKLRVEIESDVRYMLAHDVRPTAKERLDSHRGWAWTAMGVLVLAVAAGEGLVLAVAAGEGLILTKWPPIVLSAVASIALTYGLFHGDGVAHVDLAVSESGGLIGHQVNS
jgi:hypothetical protein